MPAWIDVNMVQGKILPYTMALGDPLELVGTEQVEGHITYYQVLSRPVGCYDIIDPNGALSITFSPTSIGVYYIPMYNYVRSPFPNGGVYSTLCVNVVERIVPSTRWFRKPLPNIAVN